MVTGFLGAGKTTLINRLLGEPGGRRLAAVVNDFGAINIDAALIEGVAQDGVVSLKNGCICCSLQGDLLRTLATLLRREPVPDGIVIETSGVSDPAEIVRNLLDPVIYAEASLDTVVCLADARHLVDRPDLFDDPLLRAQLKAADFIVLTKTDLVSEREAAAVRSRLSALRPARLIFDVSDGAVPPELLFAGPPSSERAALAPPSRFTAGRFQSLTWTADRPLALARFQQAIGRLSRQLLRAKGFVAFDHTPGRVLFQLVGERATVSRAPAAMEGGTATALVLIGLAGGFDEAQARALLEDCVFDRFD